MGEKKKRLAGAEAYQNVSADMRLCACIDVSLAHWRLVRALAAPVLSGTSTTSRVWGGCFRLHTRSSRRAATKEKRRQTHPELSRLGRKHSRTSPLRGRGVHMFTRHKPRQGGDSGFRRIQWRKALCVFSAGEVLVGFTTKKRNEQHPEEFKTDSK